MLIYSGISKCMYPTNFARMRATDIQHGQMAPASVHRDVSDGAQCHSLNMSLHAASTQSDMVLPAVTREGGYRLRTLQQLAQPVRLCEWVVDRYRGRGLSCLAGPLQQHTTKTSLNQPALCTIKDHSMKGHMPGSREKEQEKRGWHWNEIIAGC